jgi:uncharacterized cupredoxin-like copper-binding protein
VPGRPFAFLTLLALAGGGLAGCGGSDQGGSTASAAATASAASVDPATTAAKGAIKVDMTNFRFSPSSLTARPGRLRVTAANSGSEEHELVLIRTDAAAGSLPVKKGKASEQGSVGEISQQRPGQAASHTFVLKPGRYVYICNVPGHYQAGMRGTLTVR